MSQDFSFRQALNLQQKLTLAQRQNLLLDQVLTLRLELVAALRAGPEGSGNYTPEGTCPHCNRKLNPVEVISGFNQDPHDFTTECTGCNTRFNPKLIWRLLGSSNRVELQFYCDMQARDKISGLEHLSPTEFEREYPALFHSVIVHNGTLKAAYATLGITYQFEELVDPEEKIKPFLGHLPDTLISQLSGVSLAEVRGLRKELHIKPCTQRGMIESAQIRRHNTSDHSENPC